MQLESWKLFQKITLNLYDGVKTINLCSSIFSGSDLEEKRKTIHFIIRQSSMLFFASYNDMTKHTQNAFIL